MSCEASPRMALQLETRTPAELSEPVIRISYFTVTSHGAVKQEGDDAWVLVSFESKVFTGLSPDPEPPIVVILVPLSQLFADSFE